MAEQRQRKREYMRRWRAAHPENRNYQRAYNARYGADPRNAEAPRARANEWRRRNPERKKAANRVHYEANKDRYAEQARRWKAENAERWRSYLRMYSEERRARLKAVTIGDVDLDALLDEAAGRCGICLSPLGDDFHLDHIIPVSRGGPHSQENLQIAHPRCNRSKGARLIPAGYK